jgi:hypothetical protein
MGMPDTFVYVGDNMEKIDALLNDRSKREKIRRELYSDTPLVDIFVTNQVGFTQKGEKILREKWYNLNGLWQEYQPVEEIARQGYKDALDAAMERELDIHSYWICAQGLPFAVCVAWSEKQVTRLLITPPTNEPPVPREKLTRELPMLLTTREARAAKELSPKLLKHEQLKTLPLPQYGQVVSAHHDGKSLMQKYKLPGPRVTPEAKDWGKSPYLPHVPALDAIIKAAEEADIVQPYPNEGRQLQQEIEELLELAQLRDDPTALVSTQPGRERRKISRFLLLRPQPLGASYNTLTAPPAPVIQTGRELARWYEAETPGLDQRQALNYLLPHMDWSPPRQARVWAALNVALYGALLAAWHFKWTDQRTSMRPRPIEVSQYISVLYNFQVNATGSTDGDPRKGLQPSPGTPRHPAYPAGHSTVAGAGNAVLAYFFPDFTADFEDLADNAGMARLWAGIHYRSDRFGLALGRVVANLVIDQLHRDGVDARRL